MVAVTSNLPNRAHHEMIDSDTIWAIEIVDLAFRIPNSHMTDAWTAASYAAVRCGGGDRRHRHGGGAVAMHNITMVVVPTLRRKDNVDGKCRLSA